MNDEPPILIDATSVRVITPDEDKKLALVDAKQCLSILSNYAGNLSAFVRYFNGRTTEERQWILFTAERLMKQNKELYTEWREIKALGQSVRIELMQAEALDRAEGNHVGFEEKMTNKGITVVYKEVNDHNNIKLWLGDVLAGRTARAKAKPTTSKSEDEEADEEDDDALQRAME